MDELHGGNIFRAAEQLGLDEGEIIDFSASINPLGIPKTVLASIKDALRYIDNYPDSEARQLTAAIADQFAIDPQTVVCGNGSTELIYLVIRALNPDKILIPAPTFCEYERAAGSGRKIISFPLSAENGFDLDPDAFINAMAGGSNSLSYKMALTTSVDMAFLCNPNNPTGDILRKADILKIASAARDLKCHLVVDEAFIDFSPEDSLVTEVQDNPYLIVLRSMTKFYALSGLRVGYGVFPIKVMDKIKEYKEPWTVNILAQVSGIAALNDTSYKEDTFRLMRTEKKTLEDGFKLLKINYLPASANYYLLQLDKVGHIAESLAEKGILIRDCSNFRGIGGSYARIAVKSNRDNMRLLKELAQLCKG